MQPRERGGNRTLRVEAKQVESESFRQKDDGASRATMPAVAASSGYSGICSPEPPNSAGKSFSFGKPSRIGNTVSA